VAADRIHAIRQGDGPGFTVKDNRQSVEGVYGGNVRERRGATFRSVSANGTGAVVPPPEFSNAF